MASCDMCGSDKEPFFSANVEGTPMKVCNGCLRYAKDARRIAPTLSEKKQKKIVKQEERRVQQDEEEAVERIQMIVPNYAQLIKNAREKRGLKQEQLAKLMNEKESLLHMVESGKRKPSFRLAEKLQTALGISLFEMYEEKKQKSSGRGSNGPLTIGDMIKQR